MPGIVAANLRCRRCADPQRRCQQTQRVCAPDERADIPDPSAGVSAATQVILGTSLLGDQLWGVEHGEYHRDDDPGVLGASSRSIEYGE